MRWDALFADLEAQAAALEHAERAAEVEERARGELGALGLVERFRAAVGATVRLRLDGAGTVSGVIARVGPDWLLVADGNREVVVPLAAVLGVRGLNRYSAAPDAAGAVGARLGLRSVLRGVARDRSPVRIDLRDGSAVEATIDRVGADFVEVATHATGEPRRRAEVRDVEVIPFDAIAAVQRSV